MELKLFRQTLSAHFNNVLIVPFMELKHEKELYDYSTYRS